MFCLGSFYLSPKIHVLDFILVLDFKKRLYELTISAVRSFTASAVIVLPNSVFSCTRTFRQHSTKISYIFGLIHINVNVAICVFDVSEFYTEEMRNFLLKFYLKIRTKIIFEFLFNLSAFTEILISSTKSPKYNGGSPSIWVPVKIQGAFGHGW